jgi:hypothetical protein
MDVSGQLHATADLPTRRNPVTIQHNALWAPHIRSGRFNMKKKNLPGYEPRFFQLGTKKISNK